MSFISDRVTHLLKYNTAYGVSKLTGIPSSTVYRFAKGISEIGEQYRSGVRNAYQRQVYSTLRTEGMPAHQARRFTWYSPEGVESVENRFSHVVDTLSMGLVTQRLRARGIDPTPANIARYSEDAEDLIRQGLSRSRKSLEQWEDEY